VCPARPEASQAKLHRRLERAGLNAWPALERTTYDGWVLGFSGGYTKRANSVNPLFGSSVDLDTKVAHCERAYAARGLPCLYRLTPYATPSDLDALLERRGYVVLDPSLVLYLDLAARDGHSAPGPEMCVAPLDPWLEAFCRMREQPPERHRAHRAILAHTPLDAVDPYERLFATLSVDGEVVACAAGVLEDGWFGLFDLLVAPQYRKRGYATALVSQMLSWAQERGARHAYLQVMQNNGPARRLYAKLGYRDAYPYWYRVPPGYAGARDRRSSQVRTSARCVDPHRGPRLTELRRPRVHLVPQAA
jgi:GNAT superfamily N-acetyltransferase